MFLLFVFFFFVLLVSFAFLPLTVGYIHSNITMNIMVQSCRTANSLPFRFVCRLSASHL